MLSDGKDPWCREGQGPQGGRGAEVRARCGDARGKGARERGRRFLRGGAGGEEVEEGEGSLSSSGRSTAVGEERALLARSSLLVRGEGEDLLLGSDTMLFFRWIPTAH